MHMHIQTLKSWILQIETNKATHYALPVAQDTEASDKCALQVVDTSPK